MLVRPIATEKAYHEQTKRTYMFNVPADASKQAVAKQVADQFNVTVLGVRIVIRKGISWHDLSPRQENRLCHFEGRRQNQGLRRRRAS